MATKTRLKVVAGGKPKNASEALGQQTTEFLECRDLRHPWTIVGMFYVGREVHRKLVCERCGTEAVDRWTPKGNRIRRQYYYAKGYQTKGVKIRPVDVRREVLTRFTVYESEEQMMQGVFRRRSSGSRKKA